MNLAPKESEIQRAILDYLTIKGHFVHRQNSGVFQGEYKGKKRFIRAGIKGASDLIGVHRDSGRIIAIEVKRPGEKITPEQRDYLLNVGQRNGVAFVAYSVDDVINQGL